MIKNQDNRVAVKYYQTIPKRVKVGGELYIFMVQANIALAWVREEHVNQILAMKGGCCGSKNPGVFKLANESDVRRWTNGGGR